jgi:predicted house-cleaning noncanonical NTP pyrophosphatase (MazG superfamily)
MDDIAEEATTVWNKLVRDRIPEIIRREGRTSETRQLDLTAFVAALKEKLVEESREAVQVETTDELLLELADVLEVLGALAAAHDISMDDIEATRERRERERGGFRERLFLLSTRQNDAIVVGSKLRSCSAEMQRT